MRKAVFDMAARYTPEKYLYASARIRSVENELVGREKLNALLEMNTAEEIVTALQSWGFERIMRPDGTADTEAMLFAALGGGLGTVEASVSEPLFGVLIRYPYDCHNIKSVLKCNRRGADAAPMLIDAGTVPAAELLKAMAEEHYDALPTHMGAAVPEALEHYAKTADPREIDFSLDRACFADLYEGVAGFDFARELLDMKTDLTRLAICVRLLRMTDGALAKVLFEKAAPDGGTLPDAIFEKVFAEGEQHLPEQLFHTPYQGIWEGEPAAAEAEKRGDDLLMDKVRRVRSMPYGPEVPLAYLWALETSVKNLRILLAGKAAGLSADAIRERVRESYV